MTSPRSRSTPSRTSKKTVARGVPAKVPATSASSGDAVTPAPRPRTRSSSTAKKPSARSSAAGGPEAAKPARKRSRTKPADVKPDSTMSAGISSDAVRERTGKSWVEWFSILDAAGATRWEHKEIARWLSDKQGVPPWWCQMLTVGYEQARGLRAVHQTAGGWVANASKTIEVGLEKLYAAWQDDKRRERWLGKRTWTVRKATENRSMRIKCEDDTTLDVMFYAKSSAKSMVTVQHNKLANATEVEHSKRYWKQALEKLAQQFGG